MNRSKYERMMKALFSNNPREKGFVQCPECDGFGTSLKHDGQCQSCEGYGLMELANEINGSNNSRR